MPEEQPNPVSQLLHDWTKGDKKALGELLPLVYGELRRVAHYHLQHERGAAKRDGGCRIGVEYLDALPLCGDAELLSLNDALEDLSRSDERQAQIVEMKFFGGLSSPEISEVLGLSRATVDRDWATARVWLHRQMSRESAPPGRID
jgi:DNA-directed RNA polymerase specialized sigma24 family protein